VTGVRLPKVVSPQSASFQIDAAAVPAIRVAIAEIARAGYCEVGVRERLGLTDITELKWKGLPIYRAERLATRDVQAIAMELFLMQGDVAASELGLLLSPASVEALVSAGLLTIDPSKRVRANASLFPVADRLVFSDHAWHKLPHPGYTTVPRDQVMFVGDDSRWLARATVRRRVRSSLDLCTGSGVQAILAAAHSERVLAVDVNPRAVDCARLNAMISGATNMEVAAGDLFEPAGAGERFDLITANPPFVVSPVDEILFRDGGPSGEAVQRRIVAGLPNHLAPGGTAQVITELGEREGEGEPVIQRVREWLGGAPMDIYMLRLRTYSPGYYAVGHATREGDYGDYLDSVGAWAANLRAHGYRQVVLALIAFQWSDAPFDRVDEAQPPKRAAGAEIEAVFSRQRCKGSLGRVQRSGEIALSESRVLGSSIQGVASATLLGRAITIEHMLNAVEREILIRLEKPMDASELPELLKLDRSIVFAAIDSLRRSGLITDK